MPQPGVPAPPAPEGPKAAPAPPEAEPPAARRHRRHHDGRLQWCSACKRGWFEGDPEPLCDDTAETPAGVHQTHTTVTLRRVQVCVSCGAWAKVRVKSLGKPCHAATASGKANLGKLRKAEQPPGLGGWPGG